MVHQNSFERARVSASIMARSVCGRHVVNVMSLGAGVLFPHKAPAVNHGHAPWVAKPSLLCALEDPGRHLASGLFPSRGHGSRVSQVSYCAEWQARGCVSHTDREAFLRRGGDVQHGLGGLDQPAPSLRIRRPRFVSRSSRSAQPSAMWLAYAHGWLPGSTRPRYLCGQ